MSDDFKTRAEATLCHADKPHEYDELKCSVCGNTTALGATEYLLNENERLRAFIRDTADLCEREDQCKDIRCEDGCCETFRGMAVSARACLGENGFEKAESTS